MADQAERKVYFTAGPARLPGQVLRQVHSELLDFGGSQQSVLEMSHRSKEFEAIRDAAEADLRRLLAIPDNYAVLFMHGGAKTQFDSVPLNLCSELDKQAADYIVNGSWSKMAAKEAAKYCGQVTKQQLERFDRVPRQHQLQAAPAERKPSFRYYCDNETIEGLEFDYVPDCADQVPLVCDMTSNFLSRPVDVSKFGIIFAGAQKNCGISGLCIVIVRKDLIGRQMRITPTIQNYQVMLENKSLYNTPLTFAIYVAGLCFKWMLEQGGLSAMDELSRRKSALLYAAIDNSAGFYTNPVADLQSRSRMNVTFLLADRKLDQQFLSEAAARQLFELKGHRSVGGFRASIYHGVQLADVQRLVDFLEAFRRQHS